ncbi:peptidoglycan-binding protein [Methanosarcina sp. T3]|uniref:peptidoglycan-binding domain-containing protein n=1 Tax=Methanosarcina sp. T3 TaxID=3439062 RepID=UPI003F877D7A
MTIGDSHDLKSQMFAGEEVLQACYDNERVLQRGDSGSAVKKVQEALIILGIPVPGKGANGVFGGETEIAVRSYQEARGLKVDGIIGAETIGSLDSEFYTGPPEPSTSPSTEPQMSKIPTPLKPESPVRSARESTITLEGESPVEPKVPPVPSVKEPKVPPVEAVPDLKTLHVPSVKQVHVPPVPSVREVSARPEHTLRHVETKPPSTAPLAAPVPPEIPQADSQGRKFHSSGIWNEDSYLEIQGGQSMHFKVKNLHVHASTIRIKANNGESQGAAIQSQNTADFEFSMPGKEPFDWRFDIEVDSDTALLEWHLYSTWVPE